MLRRLPGSALGTAAVLMLLLAGVLAPVVAPHDPAEQRLESQLRPPSRLYPMGTDRFGRCLFSRLLYGIRPSVGIALVTTGLCILLGAAIGGPAAFSRPLDALCMRVTDCFFAFPSIVLALVVVGILGPGVPGLVIAMVLPGWPKYARLIRSTALGVREESFVEAARAMGAGAWAIFSRCILPAAWGPVLSVATIGVGGKITMIAGLGFLGLGVQPPTPEWGSMMSGGLQLLGTAPHIALFTGLFIMGTVLSFTLCGEGMQELTRPGRRWAGGASARRWRG